MKMALYYPWVHLRSGVERTILEIVKRSKHKYTIFTNRFDKENTYREFRNFEVIELRRVPVERSIPSVLSAATVIASNIGGIPEIVEDGKTGLLFTPGGIKDCKEKILKLWNNSKLAEKLGKEGLKTVKKNFSLEVHYKKLMTVYNKILK